jgi:hypothetical protein
MGAGMSYLPADTPFPAPEPWEQPFWDFCSQRSLRFQSCAKCGLIRHPPMPVCAACHALQTEWLEATDDAELFTFTIIHHPNHAALEGLTPYNVALAIFPLRQDVRLVSNIIGCANADLRIGMPLALVWEEPRPGLILPRFRPRSSR